MYDRRTGSMAEKKNRKEARQRQQEIVGRVVREREEQQEREAREKEAYYASREDGGSAGGPEAEKSGKRKRIQKGTLLYEVLDYVRMIVIVVVVVLLLQTFVVVNARIPSASMEPTILVGQQIFGSRLTYKMVRDPERYDIVIFHDPDNDKRLLIKRIIGLPGDTIDIHDGDVFVNGSETPLTDSFCMTPDSTTTGNLTFPITVPENSYFMLGDNRVYSKDARYWEHTFVTRDKILGNAVFRYWPVWKIGVIGGADETWYQPPQAGETVKAGEAAEAGESGE